MNLIKRKIDKDKCNILDFREYQYNLIPELIRVCFRYLEKHGFTYNKADYREEVIDDVAYHSKHHFATKIMKIQIDPKDRNFLEIVIPKLIEGQFFR